MSFVDAVKDFVGFGDIDYEENDYVEEEMEQEEKPSFFSKKNKVLSIEKANNQPTIVVVKPKCFSNAVDAADQLKQRHPVILDVTGLDTDEAKRTVDFIAGTVYGVNGDVQKVSSGIFIATPASFDISGDYLKGKAGAGLDWSMFK
ncbi:MAG: cell division protein SepF [Clostridia bacterium]|nr:cell division protein SepF [Clostridia bacterium]